MTSLVALTIALASLLLGALSAWRLRAVREDLRYVHRSTRAQFDQLERRITTLNTEIAELRANAAKSAAVPVGSWFTPYMTINDALQLHAGVKEVLASLHIGGCSSCSSSAKETLEQAALGHGVELAEMLRRLNALMDGAPPAPAAPAVAAEDPLEVAARSLPPTDGGRMMLAVGTAPAR